MSDSIQSNRQTEISSRINNAGAIRGKRGKNEATPHLLKDQIGSTVCLIHLEKTGGVSIRTALSENIERFFCTHDNEILPENFHGFGLVSGHAPLSDFDARGGGILIGTFRHPIERLVSLYLFWNSFRADAIFKTGNSIAMKVQELSLGEFLLSEDPLLLPYVDNALVRRYSDPIGGRAESDLVNQTDFEIAKQNIQRLNFAIFHETISKDVSDVIAALGRDGVEVGRFNITSENANSDAAHFRVPPVLDETVYTSDLLDLASKRNEMDHELFTFAKCLKDQNLFSFPSITQLAGVQLAHPQISRGTRYTSNSPILKRACRLGWSDSQDDRRWTIGNKSVLTFKVADEEPRQNVNVKLGIKGLPNHLSSVLSAKISVNGAKISQDLTFIGRNCILESINLPVGPGSLICGPENLAEIHLEAVPVKSRLGHRIVELEFSILDPCSCYDAEGSGDERKLGLSVEWLEVI